MLRAGIIGMPNVGKSTLFNALTKAGAESSNYPFCTIEPNIGTVPVPDERLEKLAYFVKPQKKVPAFIQFVDIAGLVRGASKGEGLGNQFLANIREVDAIVQVVRLFETADIVHVNGKIDPIDDLEVVLTELILKDLDSFEKRKSRVEKQAHSGSKEAKKELDFLLEGIALLEQGKILYQNLSTDHSVLQDLRPLTAKPLMIVANMDEEHLANYQDHPQFKVLQKKAQELSAVLIPFSAKLEQELQELEPEETVLMLKEYGLTEPGLNRIIREGYRLLDLITYFTSGEKEVRSWVLKKGLKAPQAAGVIHTDFEKGFIKAEVVSYEQFVELEASWSKCRDLGKLHIEGKEYVFQDGDVVIFRFNV